MKIINKNVIGFIVAVVLITMACASLSPNLLPDTTLAAPTSTLPIPTSLPTAFTPIYQDDFSDGTSGWGTGTDTFSSVEYANGGLMMSVFETFYVTWSTLGVTPYGNVHIEVSVKNESVDPQSLFGIVCDEQGSTSSFYYVGVSPEGYYAFIKSADGKDDVYLKEGNSDVIVAAQGSMRIGLDCGKGSLILYVNSQKIDSVADTTYTSGVVGVFAASDDENSGTTVTFDDFVITKLDE